MWIGQLRRVTDLAEGEQAFPEAGLSYQLQSEDDPALDTTVVWVQRRGDRLIARGANGEDYAVSGPDGYEMQTVRNWLRG